MFKKIFAIAALAASMALVSCGGSDKPADAKGSDSTQNKANTEVNGGAANNNAATGNEEGASATVSEASADEVMEALKNASSQDELDAIMAKYNAAVMNMPTDVQNSLGAAANAKFEELKKGATGAVSGAVQAGEEYVKDKMPDMPDMDMPEPAMSPEF